MISAEKSVYISYSWGAEKKHPLVDELLAALAAKGISVKRDSNSINYGDSIRAYMDELAAGRAIILVLSEEYFKSPNCMYELREIYLTSRKEFRKRIFPVVLKGTKFHKTIDRIPYIRHWEEETEKLKAALDTVTRENIGSVSHNELRDYAAFRQIIDELLALIGDLNHLTEEEHLKTGFAALIERMFSQPAPDGGGGTDKTGNAANIGQHTIGNGNVFSGSGNVTVNNININASETAPQPKKEDSSDVGFKLKIAYNIPNLPPNYLPRPEYIEQFRAALQKESNLGMEGMGGIGKSVLAAALAHDKAVQAAFPDGIFWLTFGQKVEDAALLAQQNNILNLLGHQAQEISLDLSRHKLNLVLNGKRCLFIIDDIWDSKHLKCFDLSGTACRFLITSRKADVLDRLEVERKRIDLLSEEQDLTMLAQYARCALADLPKEAAEIVKECGYLPLAVAAIGSMVRGKPADRWQLALRKLQEAKPDKIACKFDYQYENLFRALQVSVEALPEAQQQYYKTLAVFPEDANIPESFIVLYWEHFAFSDDEPKDVIDALVDASLLTRVDDDSLRLHDLLRDYLLSQTEDVAALHRQLLEAYKAKYPGGLHTIPYAEPYYFYRYWSIHAEAAGEAAQASAIADALIRY
ncbi:MAG: NB-ARC domain-containing protein [Candidatus Electronema sp. V4]|uniref:NB-ARC domain-containing protein n=1 Tax=Candidatus Electronema sp. V4 TaxID=3454756 RepID=UPI0040558A0D